MSKFESLTYDEMQERNGGSKWGWLAKWAGGVVVGHFLGLPGSFAYAYLVYLASNPEVADQMVRDYYKECSEPGYNTD